MNALTTASWILLCALPLIAQAQGEPAKNPAAEPPQAAAGEAYVLGPGDSVSIWALGAEEFPDKPVTIDPKGNLDLPLVGRIRAAGGTADDLKAALTKALARYVREPRVSVTVVESKSQPVSVVGAVKTPGIQQLQGRKNLIEILSAAGGLREDAGATLRVTRAIDPWGRIPLEGATDDPTGRYSAVQIKLRDLMHTDTPQNNIQIYPHDVISVPRADLVYVVGEVNKAGGFVLAERESMSVLQAISMAGGLAPTAAPKHARILRAANGSSDRTEIAVDLKRILGGRGDDVPMQPNDILFVPNSATRSATRRIIDTALQLGVGIAVFRR